GRTTPQRSPWPRWRSWPWRSWRPWFPRFVRLASSRRLPCNRSRAGLTGRLTGHLKVAPTYETLRKGGAPGGRDVDGAAVFDDHDGHRPLRRQLGGVPVGEEL